jgi:hypothetical protein
MKVQTTRRFNGNLWKLTGGLLIIAALAAGAIGLMTVDDLEIPGTGSSESVAASVVDIYNAPYHGSGVSTVRAESGERPFSPLGEGWPMVRLEPSEWPFSPLGEGLPMGGRQ